MDIHQYFGIVNNVVSLLSRREAVLRHQKLTRAYFQIGGNLGSKRQANNPLTATVSYYTLRRVFFQDSSRGQDVLIVPFEIRGALLSAIKKLL